MAGFPPRFGTGMSPMAGTQPVAPTPTLPGLQPPMGGVPPVGAPIPLNSSNSGIAGYGGSSSGRDKFSKYLQKMNTTAPLALNRGGPVRMREGGMVQQQQFLPPMNLGRPHQNYGGYGGNMMHLGLQGGIQGALQPLRNHISQQIQQQTDQQINPFIDGVANDARETFDLQQDQLMSVNPMQPQPAYPQLAGLGLGIQQATKIPFNGNMMNRGPMIPYNNRLPTDRAVPFNQGGAVPRQTMIEDQPHMLAYIDPQEQSMLRQMGGSGQPGPGGVPAYARRDGPGSENFGAEARDFQDELDRQEEEQRQNDADDRAAAEAALRAATEQRIAAQFPSADEIEVMNTAGYDKEPTQYPTANRDSYAGFGGGQLFSNRGGLEQPFSRDNRPMTNLGNPASDFLNAESAEGTFANTGGTSSIFDDGVRDRMSNIFGGNTVNAGTGGISIPQFSSSNFTGDDGYLESSDVGYLGGSSIAGGSDIDPVTARNNLAKRMRSLDDLALARSKLGFPERTDALSSSGAYVDSMGDRISDNRALPDDVLFAAPQEFKSRSISPFDFNPSDPNTSGNIMSSGSSGLTSGLMTGDPFPPTKDSRGYMPYNPETDDFVRDDMSGFRTELQNSIAEFEKRRSELAKERELDLNRFNFVEEGRDLNRANEPYSSLGGTLGEATSDRIIDEIPYDASFEREPAVPTFTSASSGGSGLTSEPLSGDPFPPTRDAMGYIPFKEKSPVSPNADIIAGRPTFAFQDENFGRDSDVTDFTVEEKEPVIPASSTNGKFINTGGFGLDEDGEIFDSAGYNISKDYIKSLENQYETLSGLKADASSYDSVFGLARDSGMLGDGDGSPDDYEKDLKEFKAGGHYDGSRGDLENYAEALRESINDFKMNKPTPADFDPEGVVAGEQSFANNIGGGEALINDINSDIFSDSGMGGAIDDNAGVSEIDSFANRPKFARLPSLYAPMNETNKYLYSDDYIDADSGLTEEEKSRRDKIDRLYNADSGMGGALEKEAVTDINSELGTFDLDSIAEKAYLSDDFVFPDDEVIKLENLINDTTLDKTTKKIVDKSKDEAGDNLYYKKLDGLSEGNYAFETEEELLKRLRAGIRNQGWVRDAVSLGSKAHPVLFLLDKLMIKLTQKDMKEQADLLDGKNLKEGETAKAVRIQKGRHKGKYVGVVIMKDGKIVEYKGHSVMPNQFDRKDPLYDYILGEGFKDKLDNDNDSAPNDPCPAGYVLSGGVCVPIQSVGEDDETTTEDDTTEDDTSEDETPTETLDEIIARIRQPSRVPTEPTETFNPITFANKGGAMGVDPLTSGAVTDSLASATQRFLSSLTG